MTTNFSNAKWLNRPETKRLIAAFAPHKQSLRFVGGVVRDTILERVVKDVDAATTLLPDMTISVLKKAGIHAVPTGIDHGTVTAVIDGKHFEITTLRKDVATDGRHAEVAFTDNWKEDAARRDFTMNAMYLSPEGELFDYFSGEQDAKAGCVRFIGDASQRISEDYLRVLRFFRFHAHYGNGTPDADAIAACEDAASHLDELSGERIQHEMFRLLMAAAAADTVSLMQQHNVWQYVVPSYVDVQTLRRLPNISNKVEHVPDTILALAALLRTVHEGTAFIIPKVEQRWKLSRSDNKRLLELCGGPKVNGDFPEASQKKWIRTKGKSFFVDTIILLMAEESINDLSGRKAITLARTWDIPEFTVTGNDLIKRGLKPGKEMGEILHWLEDAWEASDYKLTKEELLAKI